VRPGGASCQPAGGGRGQRGALQWARQFGSAVAAAVAGTAISHSRGLCVAVVCTAARKASESCPASCAAVVIRTHKRPRASGSERPTRHVSTRLFASRRIGLGPGLGRLDGAPPAAGAGNNVSKGRSRRRRRPRPLMHSWRVCGARSAGMSQRAVVVVTLARSRPLKAPAVVGRWLVGHRRCRQRTQAMTCARLYAGTVVDSLGRQAAMEKSCPCGDHSRADGQAVNGGKLSAARRYSRRRLTAS
jgi:hypothetical protein